MIYCPVNANGIWRKRYNSELFTLYNEPDVVKVVKIGKFRWLGKIFGVQELGSLQKARSSSTRGHSTFRIT